MTIKVLDSNGKRVCWADPYAGMKINDPTEPGKTVTIRKLIITAASLDGVQADLGIENCPLLPLHALTTQEEFLDDKDTTTPAEGALKPFSL